MLRVTRQNYETWLRNTIGLTTTKARRSSFSAAMTSHATGSRPACARHRASAHAPPVPASAYASSRAEPVVKDDASHRCSRPCCQVGRRRSTRASRSPLSEADFNRLRLHAARELVEARTALLAALHHRRLRQGQDAPAARDRPRGYARGINLLLVSAEQFLSEYTTAVRMKTWRRFRSRYRDLDMLLVDDVHFSSGRKAR